MGAEEGITGVLADANAVGRIGGTACFSGMTAAEKLEIDQEGRVVITDHGEFVLINTYVPATFHADDPRMAYKLRLLR